MSANQVVDEISRQLGILVSHSAVIRWGASSAIERSECAPFVNSVIELAKGVYAQAAVHLALAAVDMADRGQGKDAQACMIASGIASDKVLVLSGKADVGRFGSSTRLVEPNPTPTHGGILDRLNAASDAPPTPVTQGSDTPPGQES